MITVTKLDACHVIGSHDAVLQTLQYGDFTSTRNTQQHTNKPCCNAIVALGHHFLKAECTYVLCCLSVAAITGSR